MSTILILCFIHSERSPSTAAISIEMVIRENERRKQKVQLQQVLFTRVVQSPEEFIVLFLDIVEVLKNKIVGRKSSLDQAAWLGSGWSDLYSTSLQGMLLLLLVIFSCLRLSLLLVLSIHCSHCTEVIGSKQSVSVLSNQQHLVLIILKTTEL